jgi:hypothetical protein
MICGMPRSSRSNSRSRPHCDNEHKGEEAADASLEGPVRKETLQSLRPKAGPYQVKEGGVTKVHRRLEDALPNQRPRQARDPELQLKRDSRLDCGDQAGQTAARDHLQTQVQL